MAASSIDGPISLIAIVILSWNQQSEDPSPKMLEFLVEKGAPLRFSKTKTHLYHLLEFTLHTTVQNNCIQQQRPGLLGIVRHIVGAGCDLRATSLPSSSLLEKCHESTEVFEYLYREGAQLRPGSPLATWISIGGGIGLVQEMLDAGVDLNAYTQSRASYTQSGVYYRECVTALQEAALCCWVPVDIVELLLQKGADVNLPGKGEFGLTALQASCFSVPETPEEKQQQLSKIRLLLDSGADVNSPPARRHGFTALQAAALDGDLAVAKLLLSHHPMADVNAPPCQRDELGKRDNRGGQHFKFRSLTALDQAASNGRMDMVKLLLNYNALSHYRGETGYDGAILAAEEDGHLAVADLIRQHAEDAHRWDNQNPQLLQPPRDWHEYGYDLGPSDDSESSGSETDSEASSVTCEDDKPENTSNGIVYGSKQPFAFDGSSSAAGNATDTRQVKGSLPLAKRNTSRVWAMK
ncbi:hypothetical protein diail_7636 [Diaporthe ilicicola]|nr:hypothetical protein diail_7636 [Diaporthe ilicicola]